MLLAEGWNSPRATVCMHLAPTASRRVYQQRIGRIMRIHPRKEAGVVVDFVPKGATHSGGRLTPRAARLRLLPRGCPRHARSETAPAATRAPQALPGSVARPGHARCRATPGGHPARVAADRPEVPGRRRAALLGDDRGPPDPLRSARRVRQEVRRGRATKGALEQFLSTCAAENPNRRLRMTALMDRVATPIDRADFDDLVTLVTQAPPWDKDRAAGVRILLRAIGEGKPSRPIRSSHAGRGGSRVRRKVQDRRVSSEFPEAKRLLGAAANSRLPPRGERQSSRAGRIADAVAGRCSPARR